MGDSQPVGNDGDDKSDPKKGTLRENDFEFGDCLGEGSYAKVFEVTRKETGEKYAIKMMEKRHVIKMKKVKYVKMERNILNMLNHPNIVKLFCTFQDPEYLYMVLELAPGGELFHEIKRLGSLDVSCVRFYTGELINAIEHMHENGIIHRDLKPENLLLSATSHIKVTDFGTAKMTDDPSAPEDPEAKGTFCGTAEYVSPEVLKDKAACKSSDLWALGCIVYQMLAGRPPFKAESEYLTFQKILAREFVFPEGFPDDAKDLVDKLLVMEPAQRLGAGPGKYDELRSHPFFSGLDFEALHNQDPPPMVPYLPSLEPYHTAAVASGGGAAGAGPGNSTAATQGVESVSDSDSGKCVWAQFLVEGEAIVKMGLISKRRGLFSKKRQLILTSFPRLIYIDPETMEQKGEVPWSDKLWVEQRSERHFYIHTPGRSYIMEDLKGSAEDWVNEISEIQRREQQSSHG